MFSVANQNPNLELRVCLICTETKYVVQCSNYVCIGKWFTVYTHIWNSRSYDPRYLNEASSMQP